jgi:hypothetical protein
MNIISRNDEITQLLLFYLTNDVINIILEKEKDIIIKESIHYHKQIRIYFPYSKRENMVLRHIQKMNGSMMNVRKEIGERIWGKYLASLRF